MIDAQAQKLQEVLLERTEQPAYAFGRLLSAKDEIDVMVRHLAQGQAYLADKEVHLHSLSQQRSAADARITGPFRQRYDELNADQQRLTKKVSRLFKRLNLWTRWRANSEERTQIPVLGWLFLLMLNFSASRLEHAQKALQEKQHETQIVQQAMTRQYEAGQQALLADGEYQQCERAMRQLANECESAWGGLLVIAQQLQTHTVEILPAQPELVPKGAATLLRYLSWFNEIKALYGSNIF